MKKQFNFEAKFLTTIKGCVEANSIEKAIQKIYQGEDEILDETDWELQEITGIELDDYECEEEFDDIDYNDYDIYCEDDDDDCFTFCESKPLAEEQCYYCPWIKLCEEFRNLVE